MGVYINGLEMPKKGEHIVALIKNDGKVSYFEQDTETTTCKRMKEAEAIKIPTPHGRLIDEDALIGDLIEQKIPFNAGVNESIIMTPTILEKEDQ